MIVFVCHDRADMRIPGTRVECAAFSNATKRILKSQKPSGNVAGEASYRRGRVLINKG